MKNNLIILVEESNGIHSPKIFIERYKEVLVPLGDYDPHENIDEILNDREFTYDALQSIFDNCEIHIAGLGNYLCFQDGDIFAIKVGWYLNDKGELVEDKIDKESEDFLEGDKTYDNC